MELKKVAVYPKCLNNYSFISEDGKKYSYPFSLTFIITCLYRVLNRKDHETLNGSDNKILSVAFMFF